MLATDVPFPIYFDKVGKPLDSGSIYFGVANKNPETNPLTVYWDAAGTQPVAQPAKTIAGYPVRAGTIANIFSTSDYSVTVRDSTGQLVFYSPTSISFLNTTGKVSLNAFVGYDSTGATDSTAALVSACAALGTQGGIVEFLGTCFINQNFTLPDNVTLRGFSPSAGQRQAADYTTANVPSMLIVNGAITITLGNRCCVSDMVIVEKNISALGTYPMPFANSSVALAAVAAFSGNLFVPANVNPICDIKLENLLCLGFAYLFNGLSSPGLNRPNFNRVYGDCTNGIHVVNVFDLGRASDCEMWPFTTTQLNDPTLFYRAGAGFYTGAGATWMNWSNCFAYGYAVGHDVDGVQDVRQINCAADNTTGTAQSCIGFRFRGAIANVVNITSGATAQGNTGFLINTTPQNGINDVKLIAPVCHGSNSANGYIHVVSGNYTIAEGFFSDNSSVGHIKLDSTAGSGSVVSPTFANSGGNAPIFGDAGAISRCTLTNPLYQGTYVKQPPNSWTPTLNFGGLSTGISYTTQVGRWKLVDGMVFAEFCIVLSSKGSATGIAHIGNLPLTVSSFTGLPDSGGGAVYYLNMAGLSSPPLAAAAEGASFLNLYSGSATGITSLTDANFTNTTTIVGSVSYFPA